MAVLFASTFAVVAPVTMRTSISFHQRQTVRRSLVVSGWPAWSTRSPAATHWRHPPDGLVEETRLPQQCHRRPEGRQRRHTQHTALAAQVMGSALVARLAAAITAIDAELAGLDRQITERFQQHDSADVLLSMPGFGPILALHGSW
jgi:hypothetical protein